jgi:hypothetical protein
LALVRSAFRRGPGRWLVPPPYYDIVACRCMTASTSPSALSPRMLFLRTIDTILLQSSSVSETPTCIRCEDFYCVVIVIRIRITAGGVQDNDRDMVYCNSCTSPHFGRGKLQAEAVFRRRASKAVLRSPGATPASTQPGGRPPAPETLGPAHPGDPCPESAEGAGSPAERSRRRGADFGSG